MATISTINRVVFGQLVRAARAWLQIPRQDLSTKIKVSHVTLAEIEAGNPHVDLEKLKILQEHLESLGFEFPHGTRDLNIRYDARYPCPTVVAIKVPEMTMPTGSRIAHILKTEPAALFDALKAVGVTFSNEETLVHVLECLDDWAGPLVKLTIPHKTYGFKLYRPYNGGPNDADLLRILSRYPFGDGEERHLIRNMIPKISERHHQDSGPIETVRIQGKSS